MRWPGLWGEVRVVGWGSGARRGIDLVCQEPNPYPFGQGPAFSPGRSYHACDLRFGRRTETFSQTPDRDVLADFRSSLPWIRCSHHTRKLPFSFGEGVYGCT